jgi:hypothetical protein
MCGHEASGATRIRGILEGESVPDMFIPQLIELNALGRFQFEKLTKFYSLDQINQAAQDSEKGAQSNPSSAYQRCKRGRKLHLTGRKSRSLPRSAKVRRSVPGRSAHRYVDRRSVRLAGCADVGENAIGSETHEDRNDQVTPAKPPSPFLRFMSTPKN